MSVSRKVLRKMKKVMGVIGAIPVLTACSSQISRADGEVRATFDYFTGTLCLSGNRVIDCNSTSNWTKSHDPSLVTSIVIEGDTEEIDGFSFSRFRYLRNVILSKSVTRIGRFAFYGCKRLSEVNMPNVKEIGELAFYNCQSLVKVNMPNVKKIAQSAFSGCISLTNIDITNVKEISELAFYNCRSLVKVNMPNVKKISQGAFASCERLQEVDMSNVEKIDQSAFYNCGFTDLILPSSITQIGSHAFLRCQSLSAITLPDNIAMIDSCTFMLCEALKTVNLGKNEGNVIIKENAFFGCKNLVHFNTNKYNVKFDHGALGDTPLNYLGGRTILWPYLNYNYDYNYLVPHTFLVDKTKYWGH